MMESSNEDRSVDDQICQRVIDSVPPDVENRLRSQLTDFRSRLDSPEATAPAAVRGATRFTAWWKLSAMCAAVVLLVAVVGVVLSPQTGMAEVRAALLEQPWVHLRCVEPDQSVAQAWFSMAKDVSASRDTEAIKYEDHRLRVYYSYNPTEQVLYRG